MLQSLLRMEHKSKNAVRAQYILNMYIYLGCSICTAAHYLNLFCYKKKKRLKYVSKLK